MGIAWPAVLLIIGLVTIGVVLAKVAPPQWQAYEVLLFIACIAVVWSSDRRASRLNRDAWIASSSGEHEFDYRPWDVEQAISRLRVGVSRTAPIIIPVRTNRGSVEQIASDALTQAFRR